MSGLFEDPPAPDGPGLFPAAPPEAAPLAYRVLARKYRPQRLDDLIGQETLVRVLRRAFALGRVAHAFMLTGVRGVGKTTTARIIARALNCIGADGTGGPTADPCGVLLHCRAIHAHPHPARNPDPHPTWPAGLPADRVVAIGTTAVRALESAASTGCLCGRTDLYIHGDHTFRMVDVLVTNFHLPRSSLLLLVEAFGGPVWRRHYRTALGAGYRFLSFGDAMVVARAGDKGTPEALVGQADPGGLR
jgi:hypothetical protein